MDSIDRRVNEMVAETSRTMSAEMTPPPLAGDDGSQRAVADETFLPFGAEGGEDRGLDPARDPLTERPATLNPTAAQLDFEKRAIDDETAEILRRLESYDAASTDARPMDLDAALVYATAHAPDYRLAEEDYVLAALGLLSELHLWGPRFFNDTSALVTGSADSGLYDTSLRLVNEFAVTQRLPWGGEVSARALAQATEDLHQRVAGENVQSAALILAAEIPLLRGAGTVAREPLIQRERDLVYAARGFENFRRAFLFDVVRAYLDLVVQRHRLRSAEEEVGNFQQLEAAQIALLDADRSTPFDADQARNETLDAIDRLNEERETNRLLLDQFKILIGLPIEEGLAIAETVPAVPAPDVTIPEAVHAALDLRLDLQSERDRLDDARRRVSNARNALLGDLDVIASASIGPDSDLSEAGFRFDGGDSDFQAGITYGWPLDREIERSQLRQTQILLERAVREYERFRDQIAASVRAAVRGLDTALLSLHIQKRNVSIALDRRASIEAQPDRATVRQKTDAIRQLSSARNALSIAERDVQVAILGYLVATGQLRVHPDGTLEPLGPAGAGPWGDTPSAPEPEVAPQPEPEPGPGA